MSSPPRKTIVIEIYKAGTAIVFVLLLAGTIAAGIAGWVMDIISPPIALALSLGGPLACIAIFGPIFVMFDNNDLLHAIARSQDRR